MDHGQQVPLQSIDFDRVGIHDFVRGLIPKEEGRVVNGPRHFSLIFKLFADVFLPFLHPISVD